MEEDLGSHVAKKTEVQSGSVLHTYFQGDISAMVDEHFTRALSKATKPKEERSKNKRHRKSPQTNGTSQWKTQPQRGFQSMFSSEQHQLGTTGNPQSNSGLSLNHPPNSAILWSGGPRQDLSLAVPPMIHSSAVAPDGLVMAENQYANSLLNLFTMVDLTSAQWWWPQPNQTSFLDRQGILDLVTRWVLMSALILVYR